ncbi:hypothetical protein [Coraliomargarita parva]|uniref:hypothetical protein n=1 Tax=Coraliomargarita parva TaxID=3014050 RepID=UPI0022B36B83|nr:hypothetical protein [Coraliomargarita parva]
MKPYHLIFFLCTIFACLLCNVTAQEQPRVFRVFTPVGSISNLRYDTKDESHALRIGSKLSEPIELPDGPLELYRLVPPPPDSPTDAKPVKVVVARVDLPIDVQRFILVVLAGEGFSYQVFPVKDDYGSHGAGQLRLINFSKMDAALAVNKEMYQIKSGASLTVPYGDGATTLKVAANKGGGWNMTFRKNRIAYANRRAYLLVFDYMVDPLMPPNSVPTPATVSFLGESVPNLLN